MADQLVTIHHPLAYDGLMIKTRSGVHYRFDANGETQIHARHVAELTHHSRGHRLGAHPRRLNETAQPSPVMSEAASREPTDSIEVSAQTNG